jgi:hypothetical protein
VERVIAAPTAAAQPGAFVRLAGEGVAERKFDTLAAAVRVASDGDTIEVRGNGPFISGPIQIAARITIRAGDGWHPIIKFHSEGSRVTVPLLETQSALVLEGLELHYVGQQLKEGDHLETFLLTDNDLHIAGCRFLMPSTVYTSFCIQAHSALDLRNCELLCPISHNGGGLNFSLRESAQRLVVDNCLLTESIRVIRERPNAREAVVQLTRNTFRTRHGGVWFWQGAEMVPDDGARLLNIETSRNVFDASFVFRFEQGPPGKLLPPGEAEAYVAHVVDWIGEQNLYAGANVFFDLGATGEELLRPVGSLEEWRRFWGTGETNSIEGHARFEGGNLLARLEASAEQLTPEDFRLRPDSAGYRALDGKDLGADVDLVGPGAAYERWKKTPEYQQWLVESGQDSGQ